MLTPSSGFNVENVVTLNLATMFLFVSQLTNETVSCLYAQVGKVLDASILSPVTQLYNVSNFVLHHLLSRDGYDIQSNRLYVNLGWCNVLRCCYKFEKLD